MTTRTGIRTKLKSRQRTSPKHEAVCCHCVRHYQLKILNNVGSACVHTLPRFRGNLCAHVKTTCTRPSFLGAQEGPGYEASLIVASASQTRVVPIQNRPSWVWDGTASSQYTAVGPRTSVSVQFHKCISFQLRL